MAKQKETHPWKRAFSPKKAAQDRLDKKTMGNPIISLTGNYPTYIAARKSS